MAKTNKIFNILFYLPILISVCCFCASNSFAEDSQEVPAKELAKYMDPIEFLKEYTNPEGNTFPEIKDGGKFFACGNIVCESSQTCLKKDKKEEYKCVIISGSNEERHKLSKYYQKAGWISFNNKNDSGEAVNKEKNEVCYKSKKAGSQESKQFCLKQYEGQYTVFSAEEDKNLICQAVEVKWYNSSKECLMCSILGTAYKTVDTITQNSEKHFAFPFASILMMGFLIWLAIKTLAFVSSVSKQDATKFLTELLKQGYKVMIAVVILLNYQNVFTYIINPILNTSLEVADKFVDGSTEESTAYLEFLKDKSDVHQPDNEDDDKAAMNYEINKDNKFYKMKTYNKLQIFVHSVNAQFGLLQAIGSSLRCLAGYLFTHNLLDNVGLGFASIIYSLALSAFGFLFSIAFIFYVFDAVIQLGFLGALLPFLIITWPFKLTSKYASTGFKLFLNSAFTFMFMGILATIAIQIISEGVSINSTDSLNLTDLMHAITNTDIKTLDKIVNVISIGFLLFIFSNFAGFMLMGKISSLVDKFASGGIKAAAPSIATMGVSAGKGFMAKFTQPAREAMSKPISKGIKKGTAKAIDATVGLVTLRPLRNYIDKKIDKKTTDNNNDGNSRGNGRNSRDNDSSENRR